MPPEKMVDGKSFIGFLLRDCDCYKFCTGHSQKWGKRDTNNVFGVPWFFQEMQAAQVAASKKQKWEDVNKALHAEQANNEEGGNRVKRHRCRAARPGDEEVCGQVVDITLKHGGRVLIAKCLFGVRKQDRTFIEGTDENVKFVMRAIRSDYDNGRMYGRKWRARDLVCFFGDGSNDHEEPPEDDQEEEEPDQEESPVGNDVVAS